MQTLSSSHLVWQMRRVRSFKCFHSSVPCYQSINLKGHGQGQGLSLREVNLKCTHGNKSNLILLPVAEVQQPDSHCLAACALQALLAGCAGTGGRRPDVVRKDVSLQVTRLQHGCTNPGQNLAVQFLYMLYRCVYSCVIDYTSTS